MSPLRDDVTGQEDTSFKNAVSLITFPPLLQFFLSLVPLKTNVKYSVHTLATSIILYLRSCGSFGTMHKEKLITNIITFTLFLT